MSDPNNNISNIGGPASSAEPSMEEILASIRRILKEDLPNGEALEVAADDEDDILLLDASMVVKPGLAPLPEPEPAGLDGDGQMHPGSELPDPGMMADEMPDLPPAEALDIAAESSDSFTATTDSWEKITMSDETQQNFQPPEGLVGDAASDAAAGSIGALIRSISSDKAIAIGRPGLTLEDLVREELRPLLKSWLDSNLPALVERIVRAEIQRVVERSVT